MIIITIETCMSSFSKLSSDAFRCGFVMLRKHFLFLNDFNTFCFVVLWVKNKVSPNFISDFLPSSFELKAFWLNVNCFLCFFYLFVRDTVRVFISMGTFSKAQWKFVCMTYNVCEQLAMKKAQVLNIFYKQNKTAGNICCLQENFS